MQCSKCQARNDPGASFCEDCGARLEVACPRCGQPVGAGKKFRRACGSALQPGPRRAVAPASYTLERAEAESMEPGA